MTGAVGVGLQVPEVEVRLVQCGQVQVQEPVAGRLQQVREVQVALIGTFNKINK